MESFVCLGAGNVAWHLSAGLVQKGCILKQVYNRTAEKGMKMADLLRSSFTSAIKEINDSADFYLIAVSDRAIHEILSEIPVRNKLIIHTSGSVDLDVFKKKFNRYGVLYPLQTFSRSGSIDLSEVPFLVEGSDNETTAVISGIARHLSEKVIITDSSERKWIHLAAVFASNFTNFMYTAAYEIAGERGFPFSLLYPLMKETLRKSLSDIPPQMQTGPAFRKDFYITGEHIKMLSGHPDLQKLYTFMSDNIQKYYSNRK